MSQVYLIIKKLQVSIHPYFTLNTGIDAAISTMLAAYTDLFVVQSHRSSSLTVNIKPQTPNISEYVIIISEKNE